MALKISPLILCCLCTNQGPCVVQQKVVWEWFKLVVQEFEPRPGLSANYIYNRKDVEFLFFEVFWNLHYGNSNGARHEIHDFFLKKVRQAIQSSGQLKSKSARKHSRFTQRGRSERYYLSTFFNVQTRLLIVYLKLQSF